MSPSDRLKTAQKKMEEWLRARLRAGIKLGWLMQPDAKMVFIYRVAQTGAEERARITKLAGEGPVKGFKLDLKPSGPDCKKILNQPCVILLSPKGKAHSRRVALCA